MSGISNIVTFSKLSRFKNKLLTELSGSYASKSDITKLNTTTQTFYIGAGASASAVAVSANQRTNIVRRSKLSITASESKLYIIYPSTGEFDFIVTMGGLEIAFTTGTVTISGTTYNYLESVNTFDGTFDITFM